MGKTIVCKTVVPYPEQPRFVSFYDSDEGFIATLHEGLESVANQFWHSRDIHYIKNDVPADIIFAAGTSGQIFQCERLSSHEMSELAKLLKK